MDKAAHTDRELLELAAKAAGFGAEHGVIWTESEYPKGSGNHGALWNGYGHMDTAQLWNPLTDDGDALRLAVKLRMCVDQGYESAFANLTIVPDDEGKDALHAEADEEYANHGGDAFAATRRAIVRAAAEIAKAIAA